MYSWDSCTQEPHPHRVCFLLDSCIQEPCSLGLLNTRSFTWKMFSCGSRNNILNTNLEGSLSGTLAFRNPSPTWEVFLELVHSYTDHSRGGCPVAFLSIFITLWNPCIQESHNPHRECSSWNPICKYTSPMWRVVFLDACIQKHITDIGAFLRSPYSPEPVPLTWWVFPLKFLYSDTPSPTVSVFFLKTPVFRNSVILNKMVLPGIARTLPILSLITFLWFFLSNFHSTMMLVICWSCACFGNIILWLVS